MAALAGGPEFMAVLCLVHFLPVKEAATAIPAVDRATLVLVLALGLYTEMADSSCFASSGEAGFEFKIEKIKINEE